MTHCKTAIGCGSQSKQYHITSYSYFQYSKVVTFVSYPMKYVYGFVVHFWFYLHDNSFVHYSDVIMSPMASQITSLAIVYSIIYSGADQRKHQSSASLAFVRGIHRWPENSPHKGPVMRKMFPLMTSSCITQPLLVLSYEYPSANNGTGIIVWQHQLRLSNPRG